MDQPRVGNAWPLAVALTLLCLAVLGGGTLVVAGAVAIPTAKAPTSYKTFVANDGSFRCDYPSEWKMAPAEGGGVESRVQFSQGDARITVGGSLADSLMGDISRGPAMPDLSGVPGATPEMQNAMKEMQKPPVEKLHLAKARGLEEKFEEFKDGPMKGFQGKLGEGRFSEFTARDGSTRIHGYHVTILGTERGFTVTARCAEADWPKLNGAFTRVVNSLAPGKQ